MNLNDAQHHKKQPPHRHLALWLASGGIFLIVIVLWAMILPTQLSQAGAKSFSSWLRPVSGDTNTNTQSAKESFRQMLDTSRQGLNVLEAQLRAKNVQDQTVQTETDRLRARIEGAAAANETADTNSATTNTNTDAKATTKTNTNTAPKH